VSAVVTLYLDSIAGAWKLLLVTGAGTGGVLLLRWYWWRINAWSEIIAMSVAALVTIVLSRITLTGNDAVHFAKSALITASCTTIAWVLATFLTPPEPEQKLLEFYRRVHPTVYGWRKIATLASELPEIRDLSSNAFDWLMGCILVYGSLFGIGKLIFGAWVFGVLLLAVSAVAGYLIFWDLSRRGWQTLSGVSEPSLHAAAKEQS
ncbi:MAG: sodium:solute symporter family protein, partial [Candidatus Angelobacter sp.]